MTTPTTLPKDVREAVERFDADAIPGDQQTADWQTIRAHLLRQAEEIDELRRGWLVEQAKSFSLEKQAGLSRQALNGTIERAERAEAELAALRARIADCHHVEVDALGSEVWLDGSEYGGKTVAMLVLDEGAQG